MAMGERGAYRNGLGAAAKTGPRILISCDSMARWPRHVWTSIFTYAAVFVLFPLLCLLAYAWVRGWVF
jgi:hypothetical protein